jgi:tetratricopeptide (TPR) repeat protein
MTKLETISHNEKAAYQLADREQWRDAAKVLLSVARTEPRKIARWLVIAQWQRQGGDPRAAAKTLNSALNLITSKRPRLPEDELLAMLVVLTECHLESQNWEDAITTGREVLECVPHHHYGQELLATALLQAGELEEAETIMRDLVMQSPRDPLHRLRLASLLQLQGKLGEATREFERIVDLHPDFALLSDAHEALEVLDRMQTQQVLVLASEQLGFRRHLENDIEDALDSLNFHLSESGVDSLKSMIWDGSFAPETPLRLH